MLAFRFLRSVSNSSSTTNGRESVYDESEANKAPDGSSSNDSGSTVKAGELCRAREYEARSCFTM